MLVDQPRGVVALVLEPPVVVPLPGWVYELALPPHNGEYLVDGHIEVVLNRGGGEVEGLVTSLDGVVKLLAVNLEPLPVLAVVVGVAVNLYGQLVLL